MRQRKGESRTAAEVVIDDALVQDDGIDLIVEEVDRCWEVTQDQDKASNIEKALFETQRDAKTEIDFHVLMWRGEKLNFQQLENALGDVSAGSGKRLTQHCETRNLLRGNYDKVVMWTSGSYDYDDVMRALVRLDRS